MSVVDNFEVDGRFVCRNCGLKVVSLKQFNLHKCFKTNQCFICSFRGNNSQVLRMHLSNVHKTKDTNTKVSRIKREISDTSIPNQQDKIETMATAPPPKKPKMEAYLDENQHDPNDDSDDIEQDIEDFYEFGTHMKKKIENYHKNFRTIFYSDKSQIEQAIDHLKTVWNGCATELRKTIGKVGKHPGKQTETFPQLVQYFENLKRQHEENTKKMMKRVRTLQKLNDLGLDPKENIDKNDSNSTTSSRLAQRNVDNDDIARSIKSENSRFENLDGHRVTNLTSTPVSGGFSLPNFAPPKDNRSVDTNLNNSRSYEDFNDDMPDFDHDTGANEPFQSVTNREDNNENRNVAEGKSFPSIRVRTDLTVKGLQNDLSSQENISSDAIDSTNITNVVSTPVPKESQPMVKLTCNNTSASTTSERPRVVRKMPTETSDAPSNEEEKKILKPFDPEDVTKKTVGKHLDAVTKLLRLDRPDFLDANSKASQFNKYQELDKVQADAKLERDVCKYFEKGFPTKPKIYDDVVFVFEDYADDDYGAFDADDPDADKDNQEEGMDTLSLLAKVEHMKVLLSPYHLIPAAQFNKLFKEFSRLGGKVREKMCAINQMIELLDDQVRYYPPVNEGYCVYYIRMFGRNIPAFIIEHLKLAIGLKDEPSFALPVGILRFVIQVLKIDFDYWWKNKSEKRKDNTSYPLIKPIFAGNREYVDQIITEHFEEVSKHPVLYDIWMDLCNVINSFISFKGKTEDLTLKKKNTLKQNIAVTYKDLFCYEGKHNINNVKDLVIKVSLIRPSWIGVYLLILMMKDSRFHSGEKIKLSPNVKQLIESLRLPGGSTLQNLQKVHPEIYFLFLSKIFDTFPLHIIAKSMISEKNSVTMSFRALTLKDEKSKVQSDVKFNNIMLRRNDVIDAIKELVTIMNDMQLNDPKTSIDVWQFVS